MLLTAARAWGRKKVRLDFWQVDAFAERPFGGNPAGIVPLEQWLPDAVLQAIANENNLSETAFFVRSGTDSYDLRWFTPTAEVELCGHATLASAWLLFEEIAPHLELVRFATKSGILTVERGSNGKNRMALHADFARPFAGPAGFGEALSRTLGVRAPDDLLIGRYLMAVWNDESTICVIKADGDFATLLRQADAWGLIATGKGDGSPYDCVSRFFAPAKGVFEDPVTGSAHCAIVPYWAKRLGKKELRAYQASPRGGDLLCTDDGERVILSGSCALYLHGQIEI
jgi:PhzF family phenazine biosynthesis protein